MPVLLPLYLIRFLNVTGNAAVGLLFYFVTRRFLHIRPGKLAPVCSVIVHCFACGTIIYVGDPYNILMLMPVYFLCIWFCYTGSRLTRLSMFLIFFSMSTSINGMIDSFIEVDFNFFLRFFFWGPVWLLVRKFMPREEFRLSTRLWLLIDVLCLMPFVSTLFTMFFGDYATSSNNAWALGVLPCAAIQSVALLFAVVLLARHQQLEQEQSLWQLRTIYYQNLEQAQLQVRRLRHDMANHLQTLAGLSGETARTYLDQLIAYPAMNSGRRYCENEVVNTVLGAKVPQMEEEGIPWEIEASLPARLPVAEIDLCTLFANSLDNAIEACRNVRADRRYIHLGARTAQGLLALRIDNSRAGELIEQNGRLQTTKADSENHGLGLAAIRDIARRYGGSVVIDHTADKFTFLLSVPLDPP